MLDVDDGEMGRRYGSRERAMTWTRRVVWEMGKVTVVCRGNLTSGEAS